MKLAHKLDPEKPVMGNNWKLLTEKLGYERDDIYVSWIKITLYVKVQMVYLL